jgi:hypothetical protein
MLLLSRSPLPYTTPQGCAGRSSVGVILAGVDEHTGRSALAEAPQERLRVVLRDLEGLLSLGEMSSGTVELGRGLGDGGVDPVTCLAARLEVWPEFLQEGAEFGAIGPT